MFTRITMYARWNLWNLNESQRWPYRKKKCASKWISKFSIYCPFAYISFDQQEKNSTFNFSIVGRTFYKKYAATLLQQYNASLRDLFVALQWCDRKPAPPTRIAGARFRQLRLFGSKINYIKVYITKSSSLSTLFSLWMHVCLQQGRTDGTVFEAVAVRGLNELTVYTEK